MGSIAADRVPKNVSVPLPGFSGLRHRLIGSYGFPNVNVSVPLPGFSGLRLIIFISDSNKAIGFSPVAGIQWVETGIALSKSLKILEFQSRCRDSVG